MAQETFVRYGRERIPLLVPDDATILRSKSVTPLSDPIEAVAQALVTPIGCAALAAKVRQRNPANAVVTISDITRPVPNEHILPPILATLEDCGLRRDEITILIATGMHRPSTSDEKVELVGEDIARRYAIVDHKSERRDELTAMPRLTRAGTQAYVNSRYVAADFKIVTGFIEPHFMAGFSGGRKGVCPALTNVETVRKFHGFEFLDSPMATNFMLDGNPLHDEAMDVAEMAGIDFLVNVALNEEKRISAVFAGDWKEAFVEGTKIVREWTSAEVDHEFEVVITCGGGYPLDKTLYQTGKGMCSALPILQVGGTAVVASACSEALGSPSFTQIMEEWGSDYERFIGLIRGDGDVLHDQWGFQMHAKLLERVGVSGLLFACGGIERDRLERYSVTPIVASGSLPETERVRLALQTSIDLLADRSMAIIPDGPYTVPVLTRASALA